MHPSGQPIPMLLWTHRTQRSAACFKYRSPDSRFLISVVRELFLISKSSRCLRKPFARAISIASSRFSSLRPRQLVAIFRSTYVQVCRGCACATARVLRSRPIINASLSLPGVCMLMTSKLAGTHFGWQGITVAWLLNQSNSKPETLKPKSNALNPKPKT